MTNNPSCDHVRHDLVAYLDGELDPARETAIRAHLAACAGCEAERAALDGAWRALDQLPGLTPAPGLWERMEAEILQQGASGANVPAQPAGAPEGRVVRFPLWAQVSGLAAAALLTAGLGFLTVRGTGDDPQDPSLAVNSPVPRSSTAPDPIQMPPSQRPTRRPLPEVPDAPPIELPPRPQPSQAEPRPEPQPQPQPQPSRDPAQPPAVAQLPQQGDPLATVSDPVEREVIENLDLLVALSEEPRQDDAVLIENLDLLEDLEEAELDELSG